MTQVSPTVLQPPLLLATDGSPSARTAQRLLYPLGQMLQTKTPVDSPTIVVVTVQPRRSSRSVLPIRKAQQTNGAAMQTATRLLESPPSWETELREDFPKNLRVEFQTRQGRPATEILSCARATQASLIAVGCRGTGGVRELLLGSVSAVIARYAPCSVLIARGNESALALNHVLLLVDGSPASRRAIALVRQLVSVGVRRVTLLCPQPSVNAGYLFGPFVTPTPSWQLSQSLQEAQKEHSQQLLQQAKAAMQGSSSLAGDGLSGLDIQSLAQTGEPGPLICEVAAAHGANLVVLGSDFRRRSLLTPLQGLRKPRSGDASAARPPLHNTRLSATEDYTIHHAPCPVLLHRVASPTSV